MSNQTINCNVNQCRYHGQGCECTLSGITVGNSTPSPTEKRETECDSFEECNC